jgi:hypothetical protein
MATLASNQLGIYAIDGGSTSPLEVVTADVGDANPSGISENDKVILVDSSGDFNGFATAGASNLAALSMAATDLLAAATTTTLDASNTINEVAARDGVGSSTNYIASGAFSYTFSIDGLIDLTSNSGGDTGSPITLIDLAKDSKYVLVRFTTKIGDDSLGNDAGVVSYVGQALIESCSLTGGVDDIATYSATFRGYGKLYKEIAA